MALISFGNVMAIADTVGNATSTSSVIATVEFSANLRSQNNYMIARNLIDLNTGISRNRAENPKSERWT